MAVAVKNPPVAPTSSPFDRMPVVSLVGAAYVVAVLALVVEGIPALCGPLAESGMIAAAAALAVGILAAAVALFVVGARLFGSTRPVGSRAGVFIGVVGVLLALLITRWVSMWLEYWIYDHKWLGDSATTGVAITAVIGAALLVGLGYLLFRPDADRWLTLVESHGWFSATTYKGQQGQRVRRGTILGLLLIAGSGVYTMINNGTVRRLPSDWVLNIPFTGAVVVQQTGDATAPRVELLQKLPQLDKDQIQIVSHGSSPFRDGEVVSQKRFREALAAGIEADKDLSADTQRLLKEEMNPANKDISQILDLPGASSSLGAAVGPSAPAVMPPAGLPMGVLRINMYALRQVNDKLRDQYVRVANAGYSNLHRGDVVPKAEFEAAKEKAVQNGVGEPPVGAAPMAAGGPLLYQTATLLPGLQYTLPLLLCAAAIWLAWRVVNYPPFADFLIATEAELNKVSWTTRKRLVQDTIVVLATTILLAAFLFVMDQTWRFVLSSPIVGVLQIDQGKSKQNVNAEQKPW